MQARVGAVAGRCPIGRLVPVPCGWVWRERGAPVGHGDRRRLLMRVGGGRRQTGPRPASTRGLVTL